MDWQTITSVWGFNYAFAFSMIFAVLLAYWAYSPKERWKLSYNVDSSTVVDHRDESFTDKITIMYNDTPIPRATLSRVYFWNSGNRTLRRTDITPKGPLVISVSAGQHMLQRSVGSMALPAMDVQLLPEDETAASVTFEYLDPKHGFVCEILHTGNHRDITVDGILVSAQKPTKEELPFAPMTIGPFLVLAFFGLGIPMAGLALATKYFKPTPADPLFSGLGGFAYFIGSGLFMMLIFHIATTRGAKRFNFGIPSAER